MAIGLSTAALTAPPAMAWLVYGPVTQYPSDGGTWQYGLWSGAVRSEYTVNRCHGSSVRYNGALQRSVDTAPGRTSLASRSAYQSQYHTDQYYYRTC